MIYHDVGLTKGEGERLRRIVKRMAESEDGEAKDLVNVVKNADPAHTKYHAERLAVLTRRRKYVTKPNLLRVLVLRALDDIEAGVDEEEVIDLMQRFGRAKGRPNGRR